MNGRCGWSDKNQEYWWMFDRDHGDDLKTLDNSEKWSRCLCYGSPKDNQEFWGKVDGGHEGHIRIVDDYAAGL